MNMSNFIVFLCTALFQVCCGAICQYQRAIENSKSKNKVLQGHVYNTTDAPSLFYCVDLCMKDPRCRSFNILGTRNVPERSCQLNGASREDSSPRDLIIQENSAFYDLDSTRIAKIFLQDNNCVADQKDIKPSAVVLTSLCSDLIVTPSPPLDSVSQTLASGTPPTVSSTDIFSPTPSGGSTLQTSSTVFMEAAPSPTVSSSDVFSPTPSGGSALQTSSKVSVQAGQGSQANPGMSCKVLKEQNSLLPSDKYWVKLNGSSVEVYCDMITDGGGWTLVWSYTFTKYSDFGNPGNAVTPFPKWPATGQNVPQSSKIPLSETQYGAMEFSLWKNIGNEFLIKSNINNWVSCKPGSGGSLVMFVDGGINCKVVKRVTSNCNHNPAPDKFKATETYGPSLISSGENKQYYYFEGNTASNVQRYPVHDPCGISNQNHKQGVSNPHGNIFIR